MTRIRTAAALLALFFLAVYARPLYSQAQALLYGSYNNAAKAVTVTSAGAMNVSITGGTGTIPAANGGTGQDSSGWSALAKVTAGVWAQYTGTSCTNQFVRSLSALGVATCATVSLTADVTGTLPAANGGSGNASYTIGDLLYASASTTLSKLADVATGSILSSGGVGTAPAWSSTPTLIGAMTELLTNIVATPTDGFIVANNTAASAGVPVQMTPRIRFRSHVWNTTVTAADNTNDWTIDSLPVSGTTPTGALRFGSSLNGAAYTYQIAFLSSGEVDANNILLPSSSNVRFGTAGDLLNSADGSFTFRNNAASASSVLTTSSFFLSHQQGTNAIIANGNNIFYVGNEAVSTGFNIDGSTANVFRVLNIAKSARAVFDMGGIQFTGVLVDSQTAPTIASGGCTSPAVTHSNGTAGFLLTLGSSCSAVKTIVLTMPAAAHFWSVQCDNNTSDAQQAANYVVARATSTTAVTLTNYGRVLGTQADYTAADTLLCTARAE